VAVLNYLKRALSPGGHDCAGDASVFVSKDIVGTGFPQTIPHGLGVTPSIVELYFVGAPVVYASGDLIEGVHDATNCYAQCPAGWTYRVRASL
jgi:hypothetical protein